MWSRHILMFPENISLVGLKKTMGCQSGYSFPMSGLKTGTSRKRGCMTWYHVSKTSFFMCVGNALIKQEYGNYISCFWVHPIFRSFRKIKKKTALSFVMQVCLSARSSVCLSVANLLPMQGFFENISRKFKVNYNMSIKRDTLKEDPCKFMTISC